MDFSRLADQLGTSPATALPLLFLGGVLTSLNPCIYPMIPITAAIVGGSTAGAPVTRGRVFVLSLAYAIGLALVYSVLGLVAGFDFRMPAVKFPGFGRLGVGLPVAVAAPGANS